MGIAARGPHPVDHVLHWLHAFPRMVLKRESVVKALQFGPRRDSPRRRKRPAVAVSVRAFAARVTCDDIAYRFVKFARGFLRRAGIQALHFLVKGSQQFTVVFALLQTGDKTVPIKIPVHVTHRREWQPGEPVQSVCCREIVGFVRLEDRCDRDARAISVGTVFGEEDLEGFAAGSAIPSAAMHSDHDIPDHAVAHEDAGDDIVPVAIGSQHVRRLARVASRSVLGSRALG